MHSLILLICFSLILAVAAVSVFALSDSSCRSPADCLEHVAHLQVQLDYVAEQKERRRTALERDVARRIMALKAERNDKLKHVPSFFYHALTSQRAKSQKFLSSAETRRLRHTVAFCGAGASDQCAQNDDEFLRLFLSDARCYQVPRGSHPREAAHSVVSSDEDTVAAEYAHNGEADLRVELQFSGNSAFANRRVARQVSAHFHTDFVARGEDEFMEDADDEEEEEQQQHDPRTPEQRLRARKESAFGIGSELMWTGERGRHALLAPFVTRGVVRVNNSATGEQDSVFAGPNKLRNMSLMNDANFFTFFSLFDKEVLEAAVDRKTPARVRRVMQRALAALVQAVCPSVDNRPIAAWARSSTEALKMEEMAKIRSGQVKKEVSPLQDL